MKIIELTREQTVIVDDDDYDKLSIYTWRALFIHKNWYAVRSDMESINDKKNIFMHRQIMNAKTGEYVDHINHDGLDNRKGNLRLCSNAQNGYNRELTRNKKNTPYKGVFKGKTAKKYGERWTAGIQFNSTYYHLGTFSTQEGAARAYDKKARELFGDFALTNFKD